MGIVLVGILLLFNITLVAFVTMRLNAAVTYLGGMTDRFALQEHRKLFNPDVRV